MTLRPARRRFLATLPALAFAPLAAATAPATAGPVLAIGGALRDDNTALWARLAQLAGGPGARVAVLATASGDPARAFAAVDAVLRRHGLRGLAIEVAPQPGGLDAARAAAHDPRWVEAVASAQALFLTGGAQARLLDTLAPGGTPTPLLQALHALHARGGLVAGTSSGAAVLSAVCFRDASDLIGALRGTLRDGIELDRGFGFLPPSLALDQHFARRGRIGRLLPLMAARGLQLGVGVEEDSAALMHAGTLQVLGRHGVLVADAAAAVVERVAPLSMRGVRLNWLRPGDRLALADGAITPAADSGARIDPLAAGHRPAVTGPAFYPALLDEGVLVRALQRLVDGDQAELQGLSFLPPPGDGGPAFAWRLHRGPGMRGWVAADGELGVADARLDVRPVRLAQPLATPWVG
jgi:cyanophycinase